MKRKPIRLSESSYWNGTEWERATIQSRIVRITFERKPEWRYQHETTMPWLPWWRRAWNWLTFERRPWHWRLVIERQDVEIRPKNRGP